MATAARNVNVRDGSGTYRYFRAGDELPDWAVEKITNPAVLADEPASADDGAAQASDGLDQLSREQLRQVAAERGVDTEGLSRKGELLDALRGA